MQLASKTETITLFASIIENNVSPDVFNWLKDKAKLVADEGEKANQLNLAFVTVPRKTGRQLLVLSNEQQNELQTINERFNLDGWTVDRLCRVWLLMNIDASSDTEYYNKIENIFLTAEMNELVALYSSLYFLANPPLWIGRCSEGIRSNLGTVLEAIMYHNPYPYKYLSEAAWNQLVLKAFFTDKDVDRIIGLDERVNPELASILVDYANERRAAHRSINPQLWRLVTPFINEATLHYLDDLFKSDDITEKKAAALASYHSNYPPAKKLLNKEAELKSQVADGRLTWSSLQNSNN